MRGNEGHLQTINAKYAVIVIKMLLCILKRQF